LLVLLAVNGTLMSGLALNQNLLDVGATFVREDRTAPIYRLWSIGDGYPAMLRVATGGEEIALEVWEVPDAGVIAILEREPPGLTIGQVMLANGTAVFGVLGEAYLVEGEREITEYGGWRAYMDESRP
jgi:gamma-glutamylcyclotransferase (GGCT)/AIG2-like uncharacterized protein YtfP